MSWKCPDCEAEIETLKYNVATTGVEYGEAGLSSIKQDPEDIIDDHDFQDSGDSNWDGSPDYECPECGIGIDLVDLIWITDESDEEETSSTKENDEETEHEIIHPKVSIQSVDWPKNASDTSIICKNCFYMFVTGSQNNSNDNEIFCQCPKCNETNSSTEFIKLLNEGYYSKKKHVNTNKLKTK